MSYVLNTNGGDSGVSAMFLLFLLFLALKLTNTIDWSWWWITAPMWVPLAFVIAVASVFFLVVAILERRK